MSFIQDFYLLPEDIQQEEHKSQDSSRWLKKVNRPENTSDELISDTVRRLRDEEKW